MRNKIIALRGVAGCGKSTFAAYLQSFVPGAVICSADDFFMKDGKYVFDAKLLGEAHTKCRCDYYDALEAGAPLVIVDNTNVDEKHFQIYIDLALDSNYQIISLIMENRHDNKNVHGVPDEKVKSMANLLMANIKLI